MVFIKKIIMQGFKSFARRTEIPFDRGVNVVIGANGSGKSNISDALCFALGRLSIKSLRAAKARNLLFMGSKLIKPSAEASVELVLDNTDRTFAIDRDEILIKRMVRRNGQSIYKLNDETKTRQEVLETLAQAGIDPYGFNIVLQGEIQSIVKMHPEERRKIIEEVAGIAVYESRKEKSLHELDKTEEKLKEISTILRERTTYLRNLDRERMQALRFKEFENTIKRCKATISHKKIEEKKREISSVEKSMEENMKHKDKKRENSEKMQKDSEELAEKANQINKHIQKATGLERDTLHNQIANLRADVEGLKVRKESYENRRNEVERRIEEVSKSIPALEEEIKELKEKSPSVARKAQELKIKKEELTKLEEERKKLLSLKTELSSLKERIKDKEKNLAKVTAESEASLKQIEEYSESLVYKNEEECRKTLAALRKTLEEKRDALELMNKSEMESEKILSVSEAEILQWEKTKADIEKLDTCPLCLSKMTEEHVKHVSERAEEAINNARENLKHTNQSINKIKEEKKKLIYELRADEGKVSAGEIELVKHRTIKEKKEQLKKLVDDENALKKEIKLLDEKRKSFEIRIPEIGGIEEKYDSKIREIEEISARTEEDVNNTILYKERDIESYLNIIKRGKKDIEEIDESIAEISSSLNEKTNLMQEKEEQEKKLVERYNKMFAERDALQAKIQENNMKASEVQSEIGQIEEQINYLKVGKARLDAEKETIEMQMSEFAGAELLQGSINAIEERLKKVQEELMQIGSINMRALEVYEGVKKEYDVIQEKVNILDKEKNDVLAIIAEIDRKKTKEFMKTFRMINELFTQNFAQLYTKGTTAYLELENREDIFAGGVNIVVKLAKGKFFDATSLSGGEQTLVALSLLFAIQEYKPYHFYVLDEIDAALDKRNSERLAELLKKYMKGGQYIVITHNDAIITESSFLYGVSMYDGVSKILSLKV